MSPNITGKTVRSPLDALTAADLMTPNPLSIRADASIPEAERFLTEKGLSGAVVIDEAGLPLGVLSVSDLLIHHCEEQAKHKASTGKARVSELMTPVVFSVRTDEPARKVVEQMTALKVHRLFVRDHDRVIGVISALDVLGKLV